MNTDDLIIKLFVIDNGYKEDETMDNLLFLAIEQNSYFIVKSLLRRGANPRVRYGNLDALTLAMKYNRQDIVDAILKRYSSSK